MSASKITAPLWSAIHSFADEYPQLPTAKDTSNALRFFRGITEILVSINGCDCSGDWQLMTQLAPIKGGDMVAWGIAAHDYVNHKIGKPLYRAESASHPLFLRMTSKLRVAPCRAC